MKLNSKKIIAREFLILICGITLAGLVFLYTVLSNLYFNSRYENLEIKSNRTNNFLNYISDSVLRNGYINNLLDTIGVHDFKIKRTVNLFDKSRKVHLIGKPIPAEPVNALTNPILNKVYSTLSQKYDIGSIGDFAKSMADSTKRQKTYNALSKDYNVGTFDDFKAKLGFGSEKNDTGTGPVPKIVLGKTQLVDPSLKPGQPQTDSGPKIKLLGKPVLISQSQPAMKRVHLVGKPQPIGEGKKNITTPPVQPVPEPSAYNSAHHRLATAIAGDPGATSYSTPSSSIIAVPFSNTPPWPYIIMAQDSDTIGVEVLADQDSIILLKNRQNQLKNLIDTLKMYNEPETNIETFELEFITWYGKQTNFLLTFDQLSDSGFVFIGRPELIAYRNYDRLFHEKTDSINQSIIDKIGLKLNNLNGDISEAYDSILSKEQQHKISLYALIIVLTILYPFRLLYLSIRWSIRILKNKI